MMDMICHKNTCKHKLTSILKILNSYFESALEESGITPKQYGTLLTVREHPGITQKDAAELLYVDRSSMGKFIDHLEDMGYLLRRKHTTDRRAYCLTLTPEGETAVLRLWEIMRQAERQTVSALSEAEVKSFELLVDKICGEDAS